MAQKNKSAKDMAFEKERAKYRQQIHALEEQVKERDKKIVEMQDTVREKEGIIFQQEEWIDRLLEYTELSKEDLQKKLENEKKSADLQETLSNFLDIANVFEGRGFPL